MQWFNYVEDAFILDKEKAIKKIYFDPTKRLNLLQESYFIYDRSSLVKPSFISGHNNFLPLYCAVSKKKKKKKNLNLFRQQIKKDFLSKNWQKKVSYQSKYQKLADKRLKQRTKKYIIFNLQRLRKKGRWEWQLLILSSYDANKTWRRCRNKPHRNKDRKWQDQKYVWKI